MPETFYQTAAPLCFTLLGLWWLVLQTKYHEWINDPARRRSVTNITLYFLLPGSMSLLAVLSGPQRLIWQVGFIIAGTLGIITSVVLIRDAARSPRRFYKRRSWDAMLAAAARWAGLLAFVGVVAVALIPDTIAVSGAAPLTVAGIMVTIVIVLGLVLAWDYFIDPTTSGE